MILTLMKDEKVNDSIDDLMHIAQTEDILYNLYQFNQTITTVIVTKNYIDYVGYNKVARALKALNFLRSIKIIYVSYEPSLDIFIKEMSGYNLSTVNASLKDVTKDALNKLIQNEYKYDLNYVTQNLSMEVEELLDRYRVCPTSEKENFITINKDSIMKTIEFVSTLNNENKELQTINTRNESQLELLRQYEANKTLTNINLIKDNNRLKEANNNWFNLYTKSHNKINNYNNLYNERFVIENKNPHLKVIYFKEIEDINFTKFFNEIYEKLHLTRYVKALIIDHNEFIDYSTLDYVNIPDTIQVSDLVKLTKMVRSSDPKSILKKICSQSFRVEVLLVLDKSNLPQPIISNAMTFYLGKHRDKYKGINITDDISFISPYEGQWSNLSSLLVPLGDNTINPITYSTVARSNHFISYIETLINLK